MELFAAKDRNGMLYSDIVSRLRRKLDSEPRDRGCSDRPEDQPSGGRGTRELGVHDRELRWLSERTNPALLGACGAHARRV